jgi:hypothetical protein
MIRFAIAIALTASLVLGSSPRDASAIAVSPRLPGGVIDDILDRPILDPADPDPGLPCVAARTIAAAKLAKGLVRCQRLERRAPEEFNYNKCKRKALRKLSRATVDLDCVRDPGGSDPGNPGGGVVFKYSCDGLLCTCRGDDDCNDMFINAGCGDVTNCDTSGDEPVCSCLKSLD